MIVVNNGSLRIRSGYIDERGHRSSCPIRSAKVTVKEIVVNLHVLQQLRAVAGGAPRMDAVAMNAATYLGGEVIEGIVAKNNVVDDRVWPRRGDDDPHADMRDVVSLHDDVAFGRPVESIEVKPKPGFGL